MALGLKKVFERQTRLKRDQNSVRVVRHLPISSSLPPFLRTKDTLPVNVFCMPIRQQSCFSFVAKLPIQ